MAGTGQWIFSGSRDVLTTWTTFEFADGTSEAQAVAGDFGGAVLPEPGAASLAGMALAVGAAWADSLSRRDKATGWAARHGVTGLRGHVQAVSLRLQGPPFQPHT